MINFIHIKGYQSHKDTNINFCSGVNAITGASNSGKTATLRALNLVVNNKPSGDSFISHFADESCISIKFDEKIIQRIKSKKENLYLLDGEEYRAFGQEVPEDIKKTINMNDTNIQYQLDAPFLLSSTSGEIAKYFNTIANLDSIDISLSKVDSKIRNIKSELKYNEDELKSKAKEINKYDWIEKAEKEFEAIEQMNKMHLSILKDIEDREDFILKFEDLEAEKIEFDVSKAEKDLKELEILDKKFKEMEDKTWRSELILKNIKGVTEIIERMEKNIVKYEAELKEIIPEICPICGQKTE
jgi:exonuclease SbcC